MRRGCPFGEKGEGAIETILVLVLFSLHFSPKCSIRISGLTRKSNRFFSFFIESNNPNGLLVREVLLPEVIIHDAMRSKWWVYNESERRKEFVRGREREMLLNFHGITDYLSGGNFGKPLFEKYDF